VRSEQRTLEEIATPLSAEEAEDEERGAAPEHEDERRAAPASVPTRRRTRAAGAVARYHPGPGSQRWYPGMWGMSVTDRPGGVPYDREVELIVEAVRRRGTAGRTELERVLGGRYWGPGRFTGALRAAVRWGRIRRVGPASYALGRASAPPASRRSPVRDAPA
jgi:hypothetical protein